MNLPPTAIRHGGTARKDDAVYLASARELATLLVAECGLSRESSVLDIGCGSARLLYGIVEELGAVRSYVGVDVDGSCIDWLSRNSGFPFAQFHRIDFQNDRYNGGGSRDAPQIPGRFDVIALHSVFTHMRLADIAIYLQVIAAKLDGLCYLTAFVEDGVPTEEENPAGYMREWKGRLHCVRLNRGAFEAALDDAGLVVKSFTYRTPIKRQSQYIVGLK